MPRLTGTLHGIQRIKGALSGGGRVAGQISKPQIVQMEEYAGPYEFLPGDTARTIEIEGLIASQNIVIQPVPSNYGKITWNGSTLTVS